MMCGWFTWCNSIIWLYFYCCWIKKKKKNKDKILETIKIIQLAGNYSYRLSTAHKKLHLCSKSNFTTIWSNCKHKVLITCTITIRYWEIPFPRNGDRLSHIREWLLIMITHFLFVKYRMTQHYCRTFCYVARALWMYICLIDYNFQPVHQLRAIIKSKQQQWIKIKRYTTTTKTNRKERINMTQTYLLPQGLMFFFSVCFSICWHTLWNSIYHFVHQLFLLRFLFLCALVLVGSIPNRWRLITYCVEKDSDGQKFE